MNVLSTFGEWNYNIRIKRKGPPVVEDRESV